MTDLSATQRYELITRHTEEVLTHDEVRTLVDSGKSIQHYIGLEISGRVHLGTGLVCMAKVRDFLAAGVECMVWLADWHTWINDKLGGDLPTIRRAASSYFAEALKASLRSLGGDPDKVRFVLGSDFYHHNDAFWQTVIEVSKHTSLARMQRSITILGRKEGEAGDFAKLIYPAMQAADIFAHQVHIAHAGMEQRKAHVIARDCAQHITVNALRDANGQRIKPTAIHHPLILGLGKPTMWPPPADDTTDFRSAMKMSKSNPNSAVFVDESPDEIRRKVSKAFCPPEETMYNPVLDWTRHLLFQAAGQSLHVDRTAANGGPITFDTYDDVQSAYAKGQLHPMDLKNAVASALIDLLEPVRQRFAEADGQVMSEEFKKLLT